MNSALFYVVILLANIIQGITGFAGTILAMPFGIMLVGYEVAKPVLNVLGLLSGIYVFVGNRRQVRWKELGKIVLIMAAGIVAGMGIKYLLVGKELWLYRGLGIFVIVLAIQGLWRQLRERKAASAKVQLREGEAKQKGGFFLLCGAGIAHGIFVSGGPLLIGYLSKRIPDKAPFRATISTVWILLNSMILITDIQSGMWSAELLKTQIISLPFLLAGMFIGSKLYAIMSQRLFMVITYVLLLVSGGTLLFR